MTNKRKLHESVIATTVRSNKIKSKARIDASASGKHGDDADAIGDADSDGGIDGVTISDMFADESPGKSSSRHVRGAKKKSRKHREDASDFIIPSRPSAATAAAGHQQRAVSVFARLPNTQLQTRRFRFATTNTCGWRTWFVAQIVVFESKMILFVDFGQFCFCCVVGDDAYKARTEWSIGFGYGPR